MISRHREPASEPRAVGVDIGGTKIAAGLVDARGRVAMSVQRPTPKGGASEILRTVTELACELSGAGHIEAIGVGATGVIDPDLGRVRFAGEIVPGWAGAEIRTVLENATGYPVAVENDARAMAYAEARLGAASTFQAVLHVALGTGVGGAITHEGRLVRGAHGSAGEIGHLLVPTVGAIPCGCGRYDHLEAVASGPAITAAWRQRTGGAANGLREIVGHLEDGDPDACAVVESAATILGRTLAGLVQAVDVEAIVLGGGVTQIGEPFLASARSAFRADLPDILRDVPVLRATFGADAQVIGAGLLALDTFAPGDRGL